MTSPYFKYIFSGLILLTFLASCAADVRFSASDSTTVHTSRYYVGQVFKGVCSYYAKKFHGRKTASGELFDMHKLTAAHRRLPFGTILRVENLANGKTVRVKVNDRGPFKPGRILDLSYAAAKKLDMLQNGTAHIKIVIVKLGNK